MDYMRGYRGWRWVFILEGVLTCVVALAWFFAIPDFPEDVKWLNEEEREYMKVKLAKDVGDSAHDVPITFKDGLAVFKDSTCPSLLIVKLNYLPFPDTDNLQLKFSLEV
jgi:hypothetical protein